MEEALEKLNDKNRRMTQEFRTFLTNLSKGLCPTCEKNMEITSLEKEGTLTSLKFSCGHGHTSVTIEETIKIWEMTKMKLKENGKRAHLIIKKGHEQSVNPKYPKGVSKYMKVDRKNNQYEQKVKDLNTDKIIHEENEKLTDHKS